MKKLILATAVTAAVVVYFVGDKDQSVEDNTVMQNPAEKTDSVIESSSPLQRRLLLAISQLKTIVLCHRQTRMIRVTLPITKITMRLKMNAYLIRVIRGTAVNLIHITMTTILCRTVIALVKTIQALIVVPLMVLKAQMVLIVTAMMTALIQRILRKKKNCLQRNFKESLITVLSGMVITGR